MAPLRHNLSVLITLCVMSSGYPPCLVSRSVVWKPGQLFPLWCWFAPDIPKFRLVMPPEGLGSSSILSCTTFLLLHNSTVGGSKIINCTSLLHWLICVQQCLTQKHERACKTLLAMFLLDVCAEMALDVEIRAVSQNAFTVRFFNYSVYLNQSHS